MLNLLEVKMEPMGFTEQTAEQRRRYYRSAYVIVGENN